MPDTYRPEWTRAKSALKQDADAAVKDQVPNHKEIQDCYKSFVSGVDRLVVNLANSYLDYDDANTKRNADAVLFEISAYLTLLKKHSREAAASATKTLKVFQFRSGELKSRGSGAPDFFGRPTGLGKKTRELQIKSLKANKKLSLATDAVGRGQRDLDRAFQVWATVLKSSGWDNAAQAKDRVEVLRDAVANLEAQQEKARKKSELADKEFERWLDKLAKMNRADKALAATRLKFKRLFRLV